MKTILRRWGVTSLVLFSLILSYRLWLPLPANFLLVKDDLEKADCIVLLRGDDYFRLRKAVELFRQGYSKNIVVSVISEKAYFVRFNLDRKISGLDRFSEKELLLKYFEYFGKNSENVIFTPFKITSTFEEAFAAKALLLQKRFRSLILVTNVYHMRRALILFKWVFRGTGIKIYHVTAETETEVYDPEHWWRRARDVKSMITEYISLFFNLLKLLKPSEEALFLKDRTTGLVSF